MPLPTKRLDCLGVTGLLVLCLGGCEPETEQAPTPADLCETGTRLTIREPEVRRGLVAELRRSGTAFQENADSTLCYPSNLHVQILDRIVDLRLRALPANEFVIAGGKFAARVFEALLEEDIAFTYREAGTEVRLIVTDRAQAPRARAVIYDTASSMPAED